jgi:hypothetical protein
MGLSVAVVDEKGREIEVSRDPKNDLHRLLSKVSESTTYLRYIDWYGDTVFNRPQMRAFIPEWERLVSQAGSASEREIATSVLRMAERVRDEVHLYLRFEGD